MGVKLHRDEALPILSVFCECTTRTLDSLKKLFNTDSKCGSHQAPNSLTAVETFSSRVLPSYLNFLRAFSVTLSTYSGVFHRAL